MGVKALRGEIEYIEVEVFPGIGKARKLTGKGKGKLVQVYGPRATPSIISWEHENIDEYSDCIVPANYNVYVIGAYIKFQSI